MLTEALLLDPYPFEIWIAVRGTEASAGSSGKKLSGRWRWAAAAAAAGRTARSGTDDELNKDARCSPTAIDAPSRRPMKREGV